MSLRLKLLTLISHMQAINKLLSWKCGFQVVTLATYVFFIFTVIGRQKLDGIGIGEKPERMQSGRLPMSIDLYIPVYTVLQFFFYMGLLKVRMGETESWTKDTYEIPPDFFHTICLVSYFCLQNLFPSRNIFMILLYSISLSFFLLHMNNKST